MITGPDNKTLRLMVDNGANRLLFMPPLGRYVQTLAAYEFEITNPWEFARRQCDGQLEMSTIAEALVKDLGLVRHNTNPDAHIDEYWAVED